MSAPMALADVRLAHDGMTQHECSRVGCTRLTSEQECSEHAAEPAGVVHQPKEPRVAPTREGFAGLVGTYEAQAYDHGYCEGCASYDDEGLSGAKRTAGRAESRVKAAGAALLAAFDALAAERDEWKRRAEAAEADAVRIAQVHQHEWVMRAGQRESFERLVVDHEAWAGKFWHGREELSEPNLAASADRLIAVYDAALARADTAEAERDAARALVRDLAAPSPCNHFDHHGYCQTHGWMQTDPPCPHGRAATYLAERP